MGWSDDAGLLDENGTGSRGSVLSELPSQKPPFDEGSEHTYP